MEDMEEEIDTSKFISNILTDATAEGYKEKLPLLEDEYCEVLERGQHEPETIEFCAQKLREYMERLKKEMEDRKRDDYDNSSIEVDIENFIFH